MNEMKRRGYKPDDKWYSPAYRGKNCDPCEALGVEPDYNSVNFKIYPEHDNNYLKECLLNLKNKGIEIEV